MATDRVFCRFSRSPATAAFSVTEIPEDGLCLSAFVLLTSREHPTSVLMGHMEPSASWDHLGALDQARVEAHRSGWMLPSSHLLYGESPRSAADRILKEQLGLGPRSLEGPHVVSEVYAPRRFPGRAGHWDLEFLFRGSISEREVASHPAWKELSFVETARAKVSEIARTHEDVLASAGLPLR